MLLPFYILINNDLGRLRCISKQQRWRDAQIVLNTSQGCTDGPDLSSTGSWRPGAKPKHLTLMQPEGVKSLMPAVAPNFLMYMNFNKLSHITTRANGVINKGRQWNTHAHTHSQMFCLSKKPPLQQNLRETKTGKQCHNKTSIVQPVAPYLSTTISSSGMRVVYWNQMDP